MVVHCSHKIGCESQNRPFAHVDGLGQPSDVMCQVRQPRPTPTLVRGKADLTRRGISIPTDKFKPWNPRTGEGYTGRH